jgi:cell division protein WhiA
MALSDEVRNELTAIAPRRECCRLAELSALFHTAGAVHFLGRGEVALHLDVASNAVARRAFSLLRKFGVESEIRTYRRRAFDRETRYQLHVLGSDRALQVLHEAGVLTSALAPLERPPKRVVGRSCCRSAYLRGALLGGGSVSGPRAPHLEVRAAGRAGADFIVAVAAAEGVTLRAAERRGHAYAYAKGADAIGDALGVAGANDAVLAFQERVVMGEAKARANRLANADHANLVRTSRAAHVQLDAVRRLAEAGWLRTLPRPLRELAELRLEHPSLSLRELGLKCDPPVTKASAHRRMAKLIRLAER